MAATHSETVARAWVVAQPIVDAFVSSAVRNHADAQDILQDVAVAILDGHCLPPDGALVPWAIGIARHKIADYFRRKERVRVIMEDRVLDVVANAFTAHAAALTDEGHALEQCLGHVRGDARQLLDLRYREGHSPQEMARRLGRTSEAIRASLLRIRKGLRECIERRLTQSRGLSPAGGD